MDKKTFQAQLGVWGNEVRAAAVPENCKQTTLWCLGQLPVLYAKLQQTNESRYGDEITRLVQGMLKELAASQPAFPEARQLAARLTNQLQLLHEEFGLPGLNLKPLDPAPPRSRKAG